MSSTKKLVLSSLTLFLSLGFAIVIVEIYLRFQGTNRIDISNSLKNASYRNYEAHLLADPFFKSHYEFKKDNHTLFVEEVTTDSWGRRLSNTAVDSPNLFLFFGCSYTYGSGLSDKQTLPYLFSTISRKSSLNYARPGWGPHGFLRQTESFNFQSQIEQKYKTITALYFFYDFQWRRVHGSLGWVIKNGAQLPFYTWNKNKDYLTYQGSFGIAHPWLSRFYYLLGFMHFAHYLPFDNRLETHEDQTFFCALFNQSHDNLKQSLGVRFKKLVIVLPYFNNTSQKHLSFLKESRSCLSDNIELLPILLTGSEEEKVIHPLYEFHPNEAFNHELALRLSDVFSH